MRKLLKAALIFTASFGLSGCIVTASDIVDLAAEVELRQNKRSVQVWIPTPTCESDSRDAREHFHIYHVLLTPDRAMSEPIRGWITRAVRTESGSVENPFLYFYVNPDEHVEMSVPGGAATTTQSGGDPGRIIIWVQPGGDFAENLLPGGTLSVHISGGCEPLYTPSSSPSYNYIDA